MSYAEIIAMKEAIEKIGTSINERFADEQKETLEKVDLTIMEVKASIFDLAESINTRFEIEKKEMLNTVSEMFFDRDNHNLTNDAFSRQQSYIDTLVKVHSVGHRADKEIDEAVKKLKELTYA